MLSEGIDSTRVRSLSHRKVKPCLLLGNGASELIDLVTRVGAHQGAFYVMESARDAVTM